MDISSLPYDLTLAAALGLLLAVYLQQRAIVRLNNEAAEITRKFMELAASPKTVQTELLDGYPQPVCLVDPTGSIVYANRHFATLFKERKPGSLHDIDSAFHSHLAQLLDAPRASGTRQLTMRSGVRDPEWRRFSVISWPVAGKHQNTGRILAFHEQTRAHERKQARSVFERQLIACLQLTASRLQDLLSGSTSEHGKRMAVTHAAELAAMVEQLEKSHTQVRQPGAMQAVDLAAVAREIAQEIRDPARKHFVQILLSIPKTVKVVAHENDVKLALRLSCLAAIDLAQPHTDLRISIVADTTSVTTAISHVPRNAKAEAGNFAAALSTSEGAAAHAQLALVREITRKLDGTFSSRTLHDESEYAITLDASK